MRKLTPLLILVSLLLSSNAYAQVSENELALLRAQIEAMTQRLDQLEAQNRELKEAAVSAPATAPVTASAATEAMVDEKVESAVAAEVDERFAGLSWAENIRWKGDFRYRYETIDQEGSETRNRSRIRARTNLEADLSPTLEVGIGLATGGDDPVSSNQTIGGGGSSKDIKLDLAYFDWSGLANTNITGGKFKNFLVRPDKRGLIFDGDWRPEGLGGIWDNGTFFVQGVGSWLEGDSRNGTNFAWFAQTGMNLKIGETGSIKFGVGYSEIDAAGETPLFGDPDDFYGNSFVQNPFDPNNLVFQYDYHVMQAFAEYKFKLGGKSVAIFGDFAHNTDADDNDTGYLFGVKYGSAKDKGDWDVAWFYEKLEADAVLGLLTDSDFGGGGTDAKGNVFQGTYAFHKRWNFKATYFLNKNNLASGNPRDFDRLQLDMNFKFD